MVSEARSGLVVTAHPGALDWPGLRADSTAASRAAGTPGRRPPAARPYQVNPGDAIVADDDGAVVAPHAEAGAVAARADARAANEAGLEHLDHPRD